MLFNSYEFIFGYLPAMLVATFIAGRWLGARAELLLITIGSLLFHAFSGHSNVAILCLSLVANFACAKAIHYAVGGARLALACLGVGFDLCLLGYFKYFNFFLSQIGVSDDSLAAIALPIGISFYSFQQISYIVDVYRGQKVDDDFVRYVLFVTFFPHLIAGPIVHHADMMPQFARRRGVSGLNLGIGITIFSIGLAKKIFLADKLATFASPVFKSATTQAPDLASAWTAALCYTMQIYFDFSAYSDMAIGLAFMFGIRLPYNFASPYKSASIIDFWRRWHITLSRLLRDYVYIPLGGSRVGPIRQQANVFATMVIGGFWHGAGWNFIIWGAIHGAAIVCNHVWRANFPRARVKPFVGWALTFLVVVVAWVPFRADTVQATFNMWGAMIGFTEWSKIQFPIHHAIGGVLPVAIAVALLAPNTQQIMRRVRPGLRAPGYPSPYFVEGFWPNVTTPRWQQSPFFAVLSAIILVACILSLGNVSEFIYFRF